MRDFRLCRLHLLFALALMQLLTACATSKPVPETWVWRSRGQFVAIVEREGVGGATQNRHPVALSGQRLRAELASLRIKPASEKSVKPLLGEGELENLSEQIPAALEQAGPDQDVVFAMVGEDKHVAGFIATNVVTTGRVFYRDHRLNVILGMARTPVQGEDRRLQPFSPGSRSKMAPLQGTITSTSPAVTFAPGRPDWVVIALPEGKEEQAAPQVTPEQPSQLPAAAQPVPPRPAPAPARGEAGTPSKSIEERLRVLRDLRDKGLITEDEYRKKKESILQEL